MTSINLTYPAIVDLIGGKGMTVKEQSKQLLHWFLQSYYYLEDTDAAEAICDERYDKGVDGIYVDEHLRRIDILSSELGTKANQWVKEVDLKAFAGTLAQFQSGKSIRQLARDTSNPDLKRILLADDEDVARKKDSGFEVHGVFVTNKTGETQVEQYLQHAPHITLFDARKLTDEYVPIDRISPMESPITFDLQDTSLMEYSFDSNLKMTLVPLPAAELVKMPGIENNLLFAPNVRFWLGKNTPVNKALEESINDSSEHKLFPAFHNGIIVLAGSVRRVRNKLTLREYAVVNGCQSLRGLYENRAKITPELRILTKIFNIRPDSDLAHKITNRTNNQNGTRSRDFQSRTDRQIGLQNEIHAKYPGEIHYRIARGEHPEWDTEKVLENELAGKIMLSFDLKRPAETSLDIFTDERHRDIFHRPEVNADRIVALYELLLAENNSRAAMTNRRLAVYGRTQFFLLYLTRLALEHDPLGKSFITNPRSFLQEPNGRERLRSCFEQMGRTLVRLFEREVENRSEDAGYFDYKSELKNSDKIDELSKGLLNSYEAIVANDYEPSFAKLWECGTDGRKQKASS